MKKIRNTEINLSGGVYKLAKHSNTWRVYQGENTFYKKYVGKENRDETLQRLEIIANQQEKAFCSIHNLVFQDEVYKIFDGYVVEKVLGKGYKEIRTEQRSLEELVVIFSNLYTKVKGNELRNDFVFPDLATGDNIIWNDEEKRNTLIDLDGIQVPGFSPTVVSSNIDGSDVSDPLLRRLHLIKDKKGNVESALLYKDKFYDYTEKRYKPLVNDLSLLVLFYIMATGRNFMQIEKQDCSNILANTNIELLRMGLTEQDSLFQMITSMVNREEESKDQFLEALYQLKDKYKLEPTLSINPKLKQRKFVPKI